MGAMTGYIANNDLNVRLANGKNLFWGDFFDTEPLYDCGDQCVAAFPIQLFAKTGPTQLYGRQ